MLGLGTAIILREINMKKLLGISIAAILAVSPMLANAEPVNRTVAKPAAVSTSNEGIKVATTSYVKGAYTAAKTAIDGIIDDTAVTTGGQHVTAGNTVGSNLEQLNAGIEANDTKIGDIDDLKGTAQSPNNLFGQGENHGTIVQAINTTKTEANATRDLVGNESLTTNFGNGATVTGALNALYEDLGSTDSKVMVVYTDWNGGQAAQRASTDTVSLVSTTAAASAPGTLPAGE